MELQKFSEKEKQQLQKIALERVIVHWASNEDLAKEPKIFTAGKGCYVYDIHGNKYLDSFSSLVTCIWPWQARNEASSDGTDGSTCVFSKLSGFIHSSDASIGRKISRNHAR